MFLSFFDSNISKGEETQSSVAWLSSLESLERIWSKTIRWILWFLNFLMNVMTTLRWLFGLIVWYSLVMLSLGGKMCCVFLITNKGIHLNLQLMRVCPVFDGSCVWHFFLLTGQFYEFLLKIKHKAYLIVLYTELSISWFVHIFMRFFTRISNNPESLNSFMSFKLPFTNCTWNLVSAINF